MTNRNSATHSFTQRGNTNHGSTQSGLQSYLSYRNERAKTDTNVKFGLTDNTKSSATFSHATHSHVVSGKTYSEFKNTNVIKNHLGFGLTHSGTYSTHPLSMGKQNSHLGFGLTHSGTHSSHLFLTGTHSLTRHASNITHGTHSNIHNAYTLLKGVTHSIGHNMKSILGITQSKVNSNRMGNKVNSPSITSVKLGTNIINAKNRTKRFMSQPTSDTNTIDSKNLEDFVMKMMNVIKANANTLIINGKVSVNGNIVKDNNYVLKSGDVVRNNIGHFLNGHIGMAVVK